MVEVLALASGAAATHDDRDLAWDDKGNLRGIACHGTSQIAQEAGKDC